MLQWIASNTELELDGVQYFSNRFTETALIGSGGYLNYAIPIKSHGPNGYCQTLKDKVKLTEPVSWQMLDLIINNEPIHALDFYKDKEMILDPTLKDVLLQGFIEPQKGFRTLYLHTKFGIAEVKLSKMKASYLK